MSNWHDLGDGHRIQITADRYWFVEEHPDLRDPSQMCSGSGGISGNPQAVIGRTWVIEVQDPLTLSPSISCTACGNHGFVRGGKWVPA